MTREEQDYLDTEKARRVLRRLRKTIKALATLGLVALIALGALVGYRLVINYAHQGAKELIQWEVGELSTGYKMQSCKSEGRYMPIYEGDKLTLEQALGMIAQLSYDLRIQGVAANNIADINLRQLKELREANLE